MCCMHVLHAYAFVHTAQRWESKADDMAQQQSERAGVVASTWPSFGQREQEDRLNVCAW